mmetsp:Transcript_60269/g.168310  ORF Transcript_60269/g.168310 Transcript_60269/m.168310 type:complete len:409 (+) Transcript_60269:258-1484(+)
MRCNATTSEGSSANMRSKFAEESAQTTEFSTATKVYRRGLPVKNPNSPDCCPGLVQATKSIFFAASAMASPAPTGESITASSLPSCTPSRPYSNQFVDAGLSPARQSVSPAATSYRSKYLIIPSTRPSPQRPPWPQPLAVSICAKIVPIPSVCAAARGGKWVANKSSSQAWHARSKVSKTLGSVPDVKSPPRAQRWNALGSKPPNDRTTPSPSRRRARAATNSTDEKSTSQTRLKSKITCLIPGFVSRASWTCRPSSMTLPKNSPLRTRAAKTWRSNNWSSRSCTAVSRQVIERKLTGRIGSTSSDEMAQILATTATHATMRPTARPCMKPKACVSKMMPKTCAYSPASSLLREDQSASTSKATPRCTERAPARARGTRFSADGPANKKIATSAATPKFAVRPPPPHR